MVPSGERVNMPAGSIGYITQALGGSYTLFIEGNMFRLHGVDADAIGKEPVPPIEMPTDATDEQVEQMVWQQLRTCFDPEIPVNIVELGLVYKVEMSRTESGERKVSVDMTLTAPACGMGEILIDDVRSKVEMINLLGDEWKQWEAYARDPQAHVHLYGKTESRPGRKMGHVTRVLRG